ncbi:MAG: T9SS type A sorting domain-containing protein, partial [Bacteroidetes bacterium]
VLTITASTSNSTTASACDSYTWSVNGQTYTASGTYTDVVGCHTETLVLTITASTSNSTTAAACDSYTWSVNGQTYTASGTYTDVVGCHTETLVLTITASTSNSTTASACDSYTWSVNGQTYTASGTYTDVVGCHTETLVLTITASTSNSTTASACDSYTWSVNGQTYTASGTYTDVVGCHTETLVLTITASTTNSTTAAACDSYTWSVNGQTYTASGTYTDVVGCHTETLVLTITASTSNSTTASACDSYTWSVNGQTYTASGTYTDVVGCHTETLVLTITASTSNSTTASACDSYTWSVNGQTYTASGTYTDVVGCHTETLVLTITASTSNSTTASACDSYTWSVNGQTYTASGTYTDVVGCHTETLVLTIVSATTNSVTVSACDTYFWTVNGQTYTSSGTYTDVLGCHTEELILTIMSSPPATSIQTIVAPITACVGSSQVVSVNVSPGATSYTWSVPPGTLINGLASPVSTPDTFCTVTFGALQPGASGYNICVYASNACGFTNTKCFWVRGGLNTPIFTAGSLIACPNTTGNPYSIEPIDGAATYTWTASNGATVVGNSNSVTVNFPNAYTSGTICVFATTSCGTNSASRCLTLTGGPGVPSPISGLAKACPGSTESYSIAPVNGAVSYNWAVTGGATVVGSGTSASVTFPANFVSGSLTVAAVGSCGSPGPVRTLSLGTGKLPTPQNIGGDPTAGVCGQTYQYSIPSLTGATSGYQWTIPAGVTVLGPSNLNGIILQFPANFVSGVLKVGGLNACGLGYERSVNVYGNPSTPVAISGSTGVCAGSTEVYTWAAVPGATSYQCIVPLGATLLSGTPTVNTNMVVLWGAGAGTLGVKAVNACGVSGTRTLPVSITCRIAETIAESNLVSATLFPNPAHGKFQLKYTVNQEETFILRVMDQTGRVVREVSASSVTGENVIPIELNELAAGMYLVLLESASTGINKFPLMVQ